MLIWVNYLKNAQLRAVANGNHGQTVADAFWLPSWKTIYEELAGLERQARREAGLSD